VDTAEALAMPRFSISAPWLASHLLPESLAARDDAGVYLRNGFCRFDA
jgi:hypothetical protein